MNFELLNERTSIQEKGNHREARENNCCGFCYRDGYGAIAGSDSARLVAVISRWLGGTGLRERGSKFSLW